MNTKTCLAFSFFAACFLIIAPPAHMESAVPVTHKLTDSARYAISEGKVSMDFEDTALKSVLKAFSRQTGISFIANDVIEAKKVTVFLNNVSIEDALASILEANDLGYEKHASDVYLIKPAGKSAIKTVTKVYRLNYLQVYKMALPKESTSPSSGITIIGQPAIAEAGSLTTTTANAPTSASSGTTGEGEPKNIIEIVASVMSRYGRIVADRRNNSLIINDIPDVFDDIESIIKELDVEPTQVMIQAEIIETTTSALKRIGLEYGSDSQLAKVSYTGSSSTTGGSTNTTYPTFPTAFPFTENFVKEVYNTNLAASGLFKYGTIRVADIDIVLKLLAQDDDTKYLSRPKIMTINNEAAIIKISANTAIGTTSSSVTQTGQTISTAERAETGVLLRVTPQVNDKGDIFMYIEPSVSRAKASTFFSTTFMDPSYRSSASMVMVRDGDTVVVAGLIQTDNFKTTRKVPILGDIPVLGEPFKSRYRKVEDTELIIFITPHVVKKRDYELITPKELTDSDLMMRETLDKYTDIAENKKDAQERAKAKKEANKKGEWYIFGGRTGGDKDEAIDKTLKKYSLKKA